MAEITKRFGELKALDKVDLDLRRGEVHALLGENGAGKTTLMNVLFGLYKCDAGKITIDGEEVSIQDPKDALSHGVAMVHQHFRLIPNFTAFENIILGTGKGMRFDDTAMRAKLTGIAQDYGLTADLDAKVKTLAVGTQQRIEILKVLVRNPKVLILDEPTSSLTPQETDILLTAVKKLVKSGLSVVFITHKVKEVMAIADRITILTGGKNMGTFEVSRITESKLIELMMGGSESAFLFRAQHAANGAPSPEQKEVVLEIKNLSVLDDKGVTAVNSLALTLYSHEILGMAGVSGNGQRVLAEAIMGVRKVKSGSIALQGSEVANMDTKQMISKGVSYIPEDRMVDGLLPTMSVAENLVLSHHRDPPFSKAFAVDYEEIEKVSRVAVREYEVKTPDVSTHAGRLSGGNMQKLLIARALLTPSKVLIAHNPTRGLDIATTNLVLKKLTELKNSGAGVILISEDLDELMLVSDRICAINRGRITGVLEPSQYDRYAIGELMLGQQTSEGRS